MGQFESGSGIAIALALSVGLGRDQRIAVTGVWAFVWLDLRLRAGTIFRLRILNHSDERVRYCGTCVLGKRSTNRVLSEA